MKSAALLALLALTGCAQQRAATDDATCTGYGTKRGTDAYAQCRMIQDARRDARSARLIGLGAGMMAQPSPTVTCTTFGNTTTCR